jgi:predicted MPP superfamily phosphohydrolase
MPILRVVFALAVVLGVYGSAHWYLWARLVRDTAIPQPAAAVLTTLLVVVALLVFVGFPLMRTAPRAVSSPVMWVSYTWMGLAFFFVLVLGLGDIVRAFLPALKGVEDPERRLAMARAFAAIVSVATVGVGAAAMASGLGQVAIRRLSVALRGLSPKRRGYRIVQLTDIHIGPTIGREFLEDVVARTNALEPDLVAITGDLVDGSVEELGALVAPLRDLVAKDGVFFVTGNHEYYSGVDEWVEHLGTLGVRVLRNERVAIGGDDGFDLAGVDDATAHQFGNGHGMDIARATRGRDPARPLVLLAHQPKAIHDAEKAGVALQLSGHTHGGQIFPFNFLVRLQQPYVAGLFDVGATKLYVSRGTGYWGPPMRLAAPAEITSIELEVG